MSRAHNKLSARKVATLKEPGRYSDGNGLYLRIQPNGSRSWVHRFSVGGKVRERGLGSADEIGLAQARAAIGAPEGVAASDGEAATEIPLFGDFADDYVETKILGFKSKVHRDQWRTTMKTYAAPIRQMRIDKIGVDDIVAIVKPIWLTKHETATRVRGRIEEILNAATVKGFRDKEKRNPATLKGYLEYMLPDPPKVDEEEEHHAAVPWEDMPDFWRDLCSRQRSTSALALRFTILTAARTSETTESTWREFNLKERVWTIPAARMKAGKRHMVPLNDGAMAILAELGAAGMRSSDYVFPSPSKEGAPLSNMAMLTLLQRQMGRSETVHGFRSSFSDWGGEATSHADDIIEMSLAHAIKNKAKAAYRRGRGLEKRRVLMQDWEAYLEGRAVEVAEAA